MNKKKEHVLFETQFYVYEPIRSLRNALLNHLDYAGTFIMYLGQ